MNAYQNPINMMERVRMELMVTHVLIWLTAKQKVLKKRSKVRNVNNIRFESLSSLLISKL